MLVECFFDICFCIFDTCLDCIKFQYLALRIAAGYLLNIIAFAVTVSLNNGTEEKGNLAVFCIIIILFILTLVVVVLCFLIYKKTKCFYHVKSVQEDYKDYFSINPKKKMKEFVTVELLNSYKYVEIVFDILLFTYGFLLSNGSPDKDTVCILAVVASSLDLFLKITTSTFSARKLFISIEGKNCALNEKCVKFILGNLKRTLLFIIHHLTDYRKMQEPFIFPTNAKVSKGQSQILWFHGLENATVDNATVITWYREKENISTKIEIDGKKYKDGYYLDGEDRVYSLEITDFQLNDAGVYICRFKNGLEITCTSSSLYIMPFVLPTSADVKKGECQTLWYFGLDNVTDLTWYKKQGRISTKINESAKYTIRDDPVHHLKITDFQQCDEGEYVCSSGQNLEISSFLNIEVMPFIFNTKEYIVKGESKTLWVFGLHETTEFTWNKKVGNSEEEIKIDDEKYKTGFNPVYYFEILDFDENDQAEYICRLADDTEMRFFLYIGKEVQTQEYLEFDESAEGVSTSFYAGRSSFWPNSSVSPFSCLNDLVPCKQSPREFDESVEGVNTSFDAGRSSCSPSSTVDSVPRFGDLVPNQRNFISMEQEKTKTASSTYTPLSYNANQQQFKAVNLTTPNAYVKSGPGRSGIDKILYVYQ